MPVQNPREIAIFIASPGDLAPERKAFKDVIDELNKGFADGAGVKFTTLGWEDVLAVTGRRTQSVINLEVARCDFFILALHRRWGQEAPDSKYSSYTEEEFRLALERWEKTKSPEIVVFFKNVDPASRADPGDELKKVLAFRKALEGGRQTMFRRFSSEVEFAKEIDLHLRAFAKGEWKELDREVGAVDLSQSNIDALNKLTPDLTLVQAERTALALARAAVEAASRQNIEEATLLFSKACEGTTNLAILSAAAEFFRQIGDTASSGRLIHRQAAIAQDRRIAALYYMTLLPKGFMDGLMNQMIAAYPPEMVAEPREVFTEVFGQIEERMLDLMVKYYSTGEILELARFMASPEGQATVNKQPLMVAEMMEWGQREAQRVLTRRNPELYAAEPKTIDVTPGHQIVDARDVTAKAVETRDAPPSQRDAADGEDN
jgi:hypothetical protein